MPKKEDLLKKISGLILVTEKNRDHLKAIVERLTNAGDFLKMENLLDEEEKLINTTLTSIIQEELDAGHPEVLTIIDQHLKGFQKGDRQLRKRQEQDDKQQEEDGRENLLQNF